MNELTKSSFGWKRLKALGLERLATAVAEGRPFNGRETLSVVNAPLPVLAKLVELKRSARPTCAVTPVVYFPLAAALESSDPERAAENCVEAVLSATTGNGRSPSGIGIVVDRWTGDFRFEQLAESIGLVSRQLMLETLRSPGFVGPSTGELKRIARGLEGSNAEDGFADIFTLLKQAGITSIEGGTDLALHARAREVGFSSTVTQDLTRSRLARSVITAQPEIAKIDEAKSSGLVHAPHEVGHQFVEQLRAAASTLSSGKSKSAWSPAAPAQLDVASAPESPLGAEIMASIAIARLILPLAISVRAPLSLMGIKAAHAALWFGADEIGFAAVDASTAEQLALPLFSDVADTVELAASVDPTVRELNPGGAPTESSMISEVEL